MTESSWLGNFTSESITLFKEVCGHRFDTLDFTRCERTDGTYYGTGGTCRLGVDAGPKVEEERKPRSAQDMLASGVSKHMKEYSFAMPGTTFGGEDIANMVNEAANLPGEAGGNVAKMQLFILKDKQGVFVGESMDQYSERVGARGVRDFNKKDVPWAMTPEYKATLEKMGLSEAFKKVTDAEARLEQNKGVERDLKNKVDEDVKWRQRQNENIGYGDDKLGEAPKDSIHWANLKNVRSQMRDDKETIKDAPRRLSQFAFSDDGADGQTGPWSKNVTIADNGDAWHQGFDRNRKVNAQEIQDGVGKVMRTRATLDQLEGNKRTIAAIGTFSGGSDLKNRNEKVLYIYTHEVGHQVFFRAGQPAPPPNSVSLGWKEKGITGYAATNRDELFAESFAAYTFNPRALKEVDPPLYAWVDSTVNTALSRAGEPTEYARSDEPV